MRTPESKTLTCAGRLSGSDINFPIQESLYRISFCARKDNGRQRSGCLPPLGSDGLLRGFFVQVGANRHRGVRINRAVAFFDVLHDPVFVDDDVGPLRPLIRFVLDVVAFEDAVFLQHLLVHVTEKRELDVDLFGEGGVRCGTIHAHAKNFGVGEVNLSCGYSRLHGLELFRSTTCECKNVDGEEDVLLALEVAQLNVLPLIAEQGEVGSRVPYFQRSLGKLLLLSLRNRCSQRCRHAKEQASCEQTFHSASSWRCGTSYAATIIRPAGWAEKHNFVNFRPAVSRIRVANSISYARHPEPSERRRSSPRASAHSMPSAPANSARESCWLEYRVVGRPSRGEARNVDSGYTACLIGPSVVLVAANHSATFKSHPKIF